VANCGECFMGKKKKEKQEICDRLFFPILQNSPLKNNTAHHLK
jgi:hypothetical protein